MQSKPLVSLVRRLCISMEGNATHLQKTGDQTRQKGLFQAEVIQSRLISPTIKLLQLQVPKNFDSESGRETFKAGQWLDLYIPGVETVGGFSMASSPSLFLREGLLELAVKKSSHPPAKWVHEKCEPGQKVSFRFGGDFFRENAKEGDSECAVLVGGGVGINPLRSMVLEAEAIAQSGNSIPSKVHLLYAAKSAEECIFKDDFKRIAEKPWFSFSTYLSSKGERLNEDALKNAVISDPNIPHKRKWYLCGPDSLYDSLLKILDSMNVLPEDIFYEKWT